MADPKRPSEREVRQKAHFDTPAAGVPTIPTPRRRSTDTSAAARPPLLGLVARRLVQLAYFCSGASFAAAVAGGFLGKQNSEGIRLGFITALMCGLGALLCELLLRYFGGWNDTDE